MTDITRPKSIVTAIIHGVEGDHKRADEATHVLLSALNLTPEAATALMDGTAVVVPVEPTDGQLRALEKAGGFNLTGYLDALATSPYRSNGDDEADRAFEEWALTHEAADTIEALQARVRALEEALKPFADEAEHHYDSDDEDPFEDWDGNRVGFTVGDLRLARILADAIIKEATRDD